MDSPFFTIGRIYDIFNEMNYYAVQVKTRSEDKYIKLLRAMHPEITFPIYCPRRKLDIRRMGKIIPSAAAVFPGYIFLELNDEEDIHLYQWAIRRTDGFFRFLKSNQNITPMADRDLEIALHFIKNVGPLAGKSRVYFDANSRIVVLEGPLMGLEGSIIKVDKRKGRAKIKLDLYNDSFSIDLAFEEIRPVEHPIGH
ncbi:transcription termination/antitermination protein NusG [Spirochaetia bacterium]|nr:transcription termination/antitermination protein NusG [Spirochaetia bacterium]